MLERRPEDTGELGQPERFDQKIHGAAFDGCHRLADAAQPRHHHSSHRWKQRQRLLEHIQAVRVWQAQIDDERVICEPAQALSTVGGIRRLDHRKPISLQAVGDQLPQGRLIFDEKNGKPGAISHQRVRTVCGDKLTYGVPSRTAATGRGDSTLDQNRQLIFRHFCSRALTRLAGAARSSPLRRSMVVVRNTLPKA